MEIHRHFIDANGNHFVATFDSQPRADAYVPPDGAVDVPERPSPDHQWLGGAWVYVAPPDPPAPTPSDFPLSMRQLRLGLKQFGGKPASFLRDLIAAMPDGDAKDDAEIWYEETITVHWDHPMTQGLMALAGISPEAGAAMWMQAKDLAA